MIDNIMLFTAALGLQPPWEVSKVNFNPDEGRLDLYISREMWPVMKWEEFHGQIYWGNNIRVGYWGKASETARLINNLPTINDKVVNRYMKSFSRILEQKTEADHC